MFDYRLVYDEISLKLAAATSRLVTACADACRDDASLSVPIGTPVPATLHLRRAALASLSPSVLRVCGRNVEKTVVSKPRQSIFAEDVWDGTELNDLSLSELWYAMEKMGILVLPRPAGGQRLDLWYQSQQTVMQEATNMACSDVILPAILLLAMFSNPVRQRLARDFEFMDFIATRMMDFCVVGSVKLQIGETTRTDLRKDLRSLQANVELLVTVLGTEAKPWIRHTEKPENGDSFRPKMGDLITAAGEEPELHPGGLLHHLIHFSGLLNTMMKPRHFRKLRNCTVELGKNAAFLFKLFVPDWGPEVKDFWGYMSTYQDEKLKGKKAEVVCDHCGKVPSEGEKLRRCGGCRWYCGPVFQREAWKENKIHCLEPE